RMIGVLEGFALIAVVVVAGYIVGRTRLLGQRADFVLGRLTFFVLSPPLLFTVLARADLHKVFSTQLPVAVISALLVFAAFAFVARAIWRRPIPETVVGSLASGYQNGNNIGLPLGIYILGDAAASTHPRPRPRLDTLAPPPPPDTTRRPPTASSRALSDAACFMS
ncbi:MAG: AEC family transporter, partial [Alphaproteobacteria bacterium]|nr:AEC family transporter [Alphaproteobacteria bacterium]